MIPTFDETHDPARRSWVASANGHPEFPIQNLPFGVFSPEGGSPRGGIAIGDWILDLKGAFDMGLFRGDAEIAAMAASGRKLNPLLELGAGPRRALRRRCFTLLEELSSERAAVESLLHPASTCKLHLPTTIGDYTDFYAGIHHAVNVGRQFRPHSPLPPNYKYVPIGYHGRASSIRPSGAEVHRPRGQRKFPNAEVPVFGLTQRLDYELELGVWIGPGNELGRPIPITEAGDHIVGLCLLNDWSARDFQAWEYQPLGPFLAKNFMTTVSPWIVTAEALAPFRLAQPPRPRGDPLPLDYLQHSHDQKSGAYALELDVFLSTEAMRARNLAPQRLSRGTSVDLYWSIAQLITHHTCGGCNLNTADLIGTGTISSSEETGFGSLLELSHGGEKRIALPSGETRAFLEDGDEVSFGGHAHALGRISIGFGACAGTIVPGT
jgi:fumarylacetoacetase